MSAPLNFDALYEPPSDEQYAALREDIRRNGIRQSILVTPDGAVLAGRTRRRIATELGIECPARVLGAPLAEQVAAAVLDNPQRRVARDQRRAAAELLRELGWSYRRIAECLAVDPKTIRKDLANPTEGNSSVVDRVGKDHRRRPGKRLTPEQVQRRRVAVTHLYRAGYTVRKIGDALGISPSTAADDARELGLTRRGRRATKSLRADVPAMIDWRSEPTDPPSPGVHKAETPPLDPRPPAYRTSPAVGDTRHWLECFNGGDFPNRLAWNIHEAEAHHDAAWLVYVRELLEQTHAKAEQLLRVLNDPAYRETCMHGNSLDVRTRSDAGPTLRVIR